MQQRQQGMPVVELLQGSCCHAGSLCPVGQGSGPRLVPRSPGISPILIPTLGMRTATSITPMLTILAGRCSPRILPIPALSVRARGLMHEVAMMGGSLLLMGVLSIFTGWVRIGLMGLLAIFRGGVRMVATC